MNFPTRLSSYDLGRCYINCIGNYSCGLDETSPAIPGLKWSTSKHETLIKSEYTHVHKNIQTYQQLFKFVDIIKANP